MLNLSISEIARIVAGRVRPEGIPGGTVPAGCSIDTRSMSPGDLFFALKGEHADGHEFVAEAAARGAAGAVVERPVALAGAGLPQVVVDSTLDALRRLAAHVRGRVDIPVVAVTGSNGKTTTKEMTAAVLSLRHAVHKNPGNYNNMIGVPLTLLGLEESTDLLITELGSNHMGEIMQLARLVRPEVGVLTNTGRAHVGLFGSFENAVREKTDLLRALPPSGRGVVNADSPAVLQAAKEIDIDIVTFGIEAECDFRASGIKMGAAAGPAGPSGPGMASAFTVGGTEVRLPAPGRHNIYNALAAIATASLFGIGPDEAAGVLKDFEPVRLRIEKKAGITLIDDTYNANPDSVRAVLEVLLAAEAERRIFVMGEMLELGAFAAALHREVGADVAGAGVDAFVCVGPAAREAADAARETGLVEAVHFDAKDGARDYLRGRIMPGDAVLVKGSRATGMEEISDFIRRDLMLRRA
jgi:UDP-N-acetylmuramoyl-tripeptide--D-alanyl-D-alanine ligase